MSANGAALLSGSGSTVITAPFGNYIDIDIDREAPQLAATRVDTATHRLDEAARDGQADAGGTKQTSGSHLEGALVDINRAGDRVGSRQQQRARAIEAMLAFAALLLAPRSPLPASIVTNSRMSSR